MATQLTVIIDDDDRSVFKYGNGDWQVAPYSQFYSSTSWFPSFPDNPAAYGSFTMEFEGTAVAFVGNTPEESAPQTAVVEIDRGPPTTINYATRRYTTWYQSPTLSEGKHTIRVSRLPGTAIDFALVSVGRNAPLVGKTLFMDNEDSSIQYTGSWRRSTETFKPEELPTGLPVKGSSHRTSGVGDSLSFSFTGTRFSVYGIFAWPKFGSFSLSISIDGGDPESKSFSATPNSPQLVDGEVSNYIFYSNDNLSAAEHTVIITVTQCQSQEFIFDYITYQPSFETLSSMPDIPSPISRPASSSQLPSGSPSSASNRPAISSSVTSGRTPPSASSTAGGGIDNVSGMQDSPSGISSGEASSVPVGLIVGAAIGGLALICLSALLCVWLRNRNRREAKLISSNPADVIVAFPPQKWDMNDGGLIREVNGNRSSSHSAIAYCSVEPPTHLGFAAELKRERAEVEARASVVPSPHSAAFTSAGISTATGQDRFSHLSPSGPESPPSYEAIQVDQSLRT